jgi:hypothetical protein
VVAGGLATRALGISPALIREGYVDLRGAEAKDARDVAALAQVFRDPRFETFRYIYVKNKDSLRYVNKVKASKWSQSAGLQSPLEETIRGSKASQAAQSVGRLFSSNEATAQGSETSLEMVHDWWTALFVHGERNQPRL